MKSVSEMTAAVPVTRKLLEREVQKQCVDWARARGYWARKFSSMSQRSVPDYLFAKRRWIKVSVERGVEREVIKFFTEFKREDAPRDPITGLMSTDAQIVEQNMMRAVGWAGFESDNFEHFKAVVVAIEASLTLVLGC